MGIWIFTPVSEEANYKLDHARNTIQLNAGAPTSSVTTVEKTVDQPENRISQPTTSLASVQTPEKRRTLIKQPLAVASSEHSETPAVDNTPVTLQTIQPENASPHTQPALPG